MGVELRSSLKGSFAALKGSSAANTRNTGGRANTKETRRSICYTDHNVSTQPCIADLAVMLLLGYPPFRHLPVHSSNCCSFRCSRFNCLDGKLCCCCCCCCFFLRILLLFLVLLLLYWFRFSDPFQWKLGHSHCCYAGGPNWRTLLLPQGVDLRVTAVVAAGNPPFRISPLSQQVAALLLLLPGCRAHGL